MIQLFQQRDFGDKVNVTFQYITQNFRSLSLSLLYIVGPVALVAGIASGIIQSDLFNLIKNSRSDSGSMNPFWHFQAMLSPALGFTAVFGVLAIVAVSLTTYAHMKVYARQTGQVTNVRSKTVDIRVADVWGEVQPLIGRGLIISVLSVIVTVVGAMFMVIPGLYVGIVLSLAIAVTTFEGTDFAQTWNRCFTLIRDKWWSTFGLIIIMSIISGLVGLVFTFPASIISVLVGSKLLPNVDGFWVVVGNVLATVGGTLLRSVIYIALGFQYTNLVERQEGRGLLSAIDAIGTNPTQSRSSDEETY